jgi:predicted nucleic acid-binding protein
LIVALDTNILAYAEGVNGSTMKELAVRLLESLPKGAAVLPVQTLGELFNVLVKKAGRPPTNARAAILSWRDSFRLVETTTATMLAAADLAADHQFGIWDAVILSAAADADCRLLLSEDPHSGFTWRGITIVNPFATIRHPLLDELLEGSGRP